MNGKLCKFTGGSFSVIFILFFWLGDRTRMTTDVNGMVSSEYLTRSEYLSKTIGYSLAITAIIILAVYVVNLMRKKNRKQFS